MSGEVLSLMINVNFRVRFLIVVFVMCGGYSVNPLFFPQVGFFDDILDLVSPAFVYISLKTLEVSLKTTHKVANDCFVSSSGVPPYSN